MGLQKAFKLLWWRRLRTPRAHDVPRVLNVPDWNTKLLTRGLHRESQNIGSAHRATRLYRSGHSPIRREPSRPTYDVVCSGPHFCNAGQSVSGSAQVVQKSILTVFPG
jgi:hypothetical protein